MLLSHSVEGYPWASAFLPHALALWITTSPALRRRPLVTLLSALLVNELSWHGLRARQDGRGRVPGRYRPAPRRPALHARRLARRGPATDRRGSPRPPDREHQRVRLPAAESVAGAPTGRRHGDGRRRGPGQGHWHVRTRPSDPLRGRRRQLLLPAAGPEVPRRALSGSARARGSPRDVPSGPAPAAALHHGRLLLPGRDRVDVPRGSRITAAAPGRPPRARKRLAGTGARTLRADAVRAGRVLHDAVHLLPRRRRLGDLPPCRLGPRPPPRGGRGAQASAPLQPRLLSGELHEPVGGARAPLPRARSRALRRLGVRLRVARLPLLLPPHPPARGLPELPRRCACRWPHATGDARHLLSDHV